RALSSRDREHDEAGEKKTRSRHQERRDRLNGEKNSEICRAPNQIERGESANDLDFSRHCHFCTMCGSISESTRAYRRLTVGDDVVVPWEAGGFPYKINVPVGPALRALSETAD